MAVQTTGDGEAEATTELLHPAASFHAVGVG